MNSQTKTPREAMSNSPKCQVLVFDSDDQVVVLDGERIAIRYNDRNKPEGWVSLKPGYDVSGDYEDELCIEHKGWCHYYGERK